MKISAIIGEEEFDFEILPPSKEDVSGEKVWRAKKIGDSKSTDYITFQLIDGLISHLEINSAIKTEQGIVLERIMDALAKYYETRQMGFEVEEISTDDFIDEKKPYDPEQIRVRPLVLSAFQVNVDIGKGRIDLNPNFQRNFVWDDMQKSRLIESMLLKIPLPAFYFSEDKKGKFQVIDGLQRLTVIRQFLSNEFKLRNLEYLKHLEGLYYSKPGQSLYEPYDSRIESTQLNINVIEASSPLRVKYDIFYRINTGGRPLNRQEIRNCFATEQSRSLLKRLAESAMFIKATGGSVNDTRMDGQELVLRFLGFYLYKNDYMGEMNSFLDQTLDRINELDRADIDLTEEKFNNALLNAYHLFGNYSFRKCLPQHLIPGARKQFLNKAMFIAWTYILSKQSPTLISKVPQTEFATILAHELDNNSELLNSLTTGTTDKNNLEFVFNEFSNLLTSYLKSNEAGTKD